MTDSEIFELLKDVLTTEEKIHIDFQSELTIEAVRKIIEAAKRQD